MGRISFQNAIKMKLSKYPMTSFRHLGHELGLKAEVTGGRLVVVTPMWKKALSAVPVDGDGRAGQRAAGEVPKAPRDGHAVQGAPLYRQGGGNHRGMSL